MTSLKRYLTKRNIYYGFLHIAIIVLAAQVVLFADQNRKLKERMSSPQQDHFKEGESLALGELIPVNDGVFPKVFEQDQLIFVMTTTCPFCKESLPLWKALAVDHARDFSVLAISLDEKEQTLKYVEEQGIDFPVFLPADMQEFKKQMKSTAVPKTIIRAKDGRVRRIILGRLKKENMVEIDEIASVSPNQPIQQQ